MRARHWLAAVALTLPVVAASQLREHWDLSAVGDQSLFAYFGWRIAHGATLYVDIWDNKPPGIYWLSALGCAVGGEGGAGVTAMTTLGVTIMLAATFALGAMLFSGSAATLLTVLAAVFLTHPYYEGGTNRTETFVVAFELLAVTCYVRGLKTHGGAWWLAAGVACGAACLCKQVGLAAWGAFGLHTILLMLVGCVRWRVGVQRGVLLTVGAAVPLLAAAIVLWRQGVLWAAWEAVVTFNRAYFAAGASQFGSIAHRLILARDYSLDAAGVLLALAGLAVTLGVIGWWRGERRSGRRPVTYVPVMLVVWFSASVYGVAVSPGISQFYLPTTLPPLVLLSGYVLNGIVGDAGLRHRLRERAWACAALAAISFAAAPALDEHWRAAASVWNARQPSWRGGGVAGYDGNRIRADRSEHRQTCRPGRAGAGLWVLARRVSRRPAPQRGAHRDDGEDRPSWRASGLDQGGTLGWAARCAAARGVRLAE